MHQATRILNSHLAGLLVLLLFSCRQEASKETKGPIPGEPFRFTLEVGEAKVEAELAAKPEEREKGLMYRNSLADGKGMLFVFEQPGPQKFWMKNTRIPLDIGYFSPDGKLLEVHAAQPHDLSGAPSRSENVKFVLELNRNGFREMGIRMGDSMDLKEISRALRERGLDPSKYGLP